MITFKSYKAYLSTLSRSGIFSKRVDTLVDKYPVRNDLFIKHDVETRVNNALKLAKIEASEGHFATYYFQGDLLSTKKTQVCIQQIRKLGHEVSLHYDVLDANEGDFHVAAKQFEGFVQLLKDLGSPVKSVCPHGNPTKIRSGWNSNKDFFKSADVRRAFPGIIDIVVDFPKIFTHGIYLSDAGYALRRITTIATNDASNESAMDDGLPVEWNDIDDLVKKSDGVVLSVHPHRIEKNIFCVFLRNVTFFTVKKIYFILKGIPLIEKFTDKFHFLARRF